MLGKHNFAQFFEEIKSLLPANESVLVFLTSRYGGDGPTPLQLFEEGKAETVLERLKTNDKS